MVNSKQKGKTGELELSHYLTDRNFPARRGQQFKGTADSPDIICERLGHMNIECKRVEALSIYKAMEQSIKDAGDKTPIVMHRRNNKPWLAIMLLDDYLKEWSGE